MTSNMLVKKKRETYSRNRTQHGQYGRVHTHTRIAFGRVGTTLKLIMQKPS